MSADVSVKENTKTKPKIQHDLSPPRMYKVIFHNDDVTPFEFVVMLLHEIFNKDLEAADEIAASVHEKGAETVAVLPLEIAEFKVAQVEKLNVLNSHTLRVTTERDE